MSKRIRSLGRKTIPIAALLLLGLVSGCKDEGEKEASSGATMSESDKFQQVYIDSVEQTAQVPDSGEVKIKVVGGLPNPAYTLVDFKVDVKGNTIRITPLATVDRSKIVAQVIVPFEHVVSVKDLKPGTYRVQCMGRGQSVTGEASLKR
jgi:hypothetical protein